MGFSDIPAQKTDTHSDTSTRLLGEGRPSEHFTHSHIKTSHLQTMTQSGKQFVKENYNVFVMQEHPNIVSKVKYSRYKLGMKIYKNPVS